MGYRLDLDQPLPHEVQRCLAEQIDLAMTAFVEHPRPQAVHEVRKMCKRTRALVALIGQDLKKKDAKTLRLGFRDSARLKT